MPDPAHTSAPRIRPAVPPDEPAIVAIGRELVADGTTYVFAPSTTDADLAAYWLSPAVQTFVAERAGDVVGCSILRPNQPGRGAHVANAGYAVAQRARGAGVGRALAEHSLAEARRRGFTAMQFNFVVSTNEPAIALWKALGFAIVGTLPGAFRHPRLGLVDAYVMHRVL
jgi:ribosomal protein S18 acetylase RimI-like enzyme